MNSSLEIILVIGFLILSLGIHEAAHAWVADRCGDDTARSLGRLTLNPIAHLDPFMSVILPGMLALMHAGFIFGGARPVPVNYYKLRNPLRDMMLVALAGPTSNFLLAVLFHLVWKILVFEVHMDPGALAPKVMEGALIANLVLALFNMIPIPPLDGSRVMAWLLPSGLRESYAGLERFGLILVFAFLFTGVFNQILESVFGPLLSVTNWLTGGSW